MGVLILAGGLVLSLMGGHKIVANLPISEEEVGQEARRALLGQEKTSEDPSDPSLGESVKLPIWKSALEMTSQLRNTQRTEGVPFPPARSDRHPLGNPDSLQHQKKSEFLRKDGEGERSFGGGVRSYWRV